MRSVFFLFLAMSLLSFSQDYNKGLMCFSDKDYVCARHYFVNIINSNSYNTVTTEYAHYYLFLSALNSYHYDTEDLFYNFIKKFPLSNKAIDARFYLSQYLFEKKKYKEVVDLLSQINLYSFSNARQKKVFFYLGYSAYKMQDLDLAKNSFYELIIDANAQYREDALFYNSHILFLDNQLDLALTGFNDLISSKKYSTELPYYISKILFDTHEYKKLVNYLDPLLKSKNYNNYQDLVLLQAKAFYHLGKYDQSIAYFEEYKELNPNLSRDQLYQIGIAYHKKGLFGFSINHLNKIILNADDSLSQYAFYYLGDSYQNINNKLEAMNAFRSASLIDQDSLIQHDAFYQFVILCYEQKNPLYKAKKYLAEFIEKYPQSDHIDEIYSCLANIHLNTFDYDNAISVLEQSSFLNEEVKYQYQKICFHKGVQLFNDELYNDAISYFNKSINVGDKNKLFYESYYWKGESYYNLNMFDDALSSYAMLAAGVSSLYGKSVYSQAYCYLKQKQFLDAISFFKKSIKFNKEQSILYDIYVRLGDSYFALNNYQSSVDYYNRAMNISGIEDDYAAYKKSNSYVLLGDYSNAIQSLNQLIDDFGDSNYLDDAIFDLGNTYILSRNFDLAVNAFNQIMNNYKNSLFYSSSQLKLGLVYYMQEKDNEAISVLKNLLFELPPSHISQEALGILKNIYNEMGEAQQFLDLIQNVEHDYTKSELDSSTYSSAELQYIQENYQHAINAFKSYLSYYPNGLFLLEAKYFLYKSYENIGQLENAIEVLSEVVNDRENKYTTEGLLSLGRMSYELEKYISAEMYFSQLLKIASTIEHKKSAILGVLESKFHLYKYTDVINDISSLVEEGVFSGKENVRIHYLKAFSLYKTNNIDESLIEFKWLIENTEGESRAEAFYYVSLLLNNVQKYKSSQDIIFQLINEMPNYQIWIEKSFLILAKNYIQQEDMFQAQHVLLELEKKCQNEDILYEIRGVLNTHFPNALDSLNYK